MRWSSIRLWDVPTGKSLRVLPGNIGVTERAAFSTDGRRLWSLGRDSVVEWDLATGRELRSLPEKWWGSFVVTMDEKTIATAGGPAFRLRSIADGSDLVPPAIPMHMAWAMAPSPDGRLVATTDDSAVDIWETDTGVARRRVQTGGFVNSVLWSADGKSIVANVSRDGWGSGRYYQWDVATGNESPPIKAVAELRRVRLVDGNDHVLVASGEDGVTVVDRRGGKELCRFTSSATPMAVTADGRTIFGTYEPWRYAGSHRLGDDDKGAILAWDAATGKELRRIPFRGRSIDTSVFSPDGRRMATRDWPPEIVLYDTETSAEVRRFGRIEDHLGPIQFSADGLRLAAASHGGAIVWEVATGMELHRFTGLGGSINHIAFTADGKRLITTGFDTSALVWDVSQ
jgi:WD40 repeat protein